MANDLRARTSPLVLSSAPGLAEALHLISICWGEKKSFQSCLQYPNQVGCVWDTAQLFPRKPNVCVEADQESPSDFGYIPGAKKQSCPFLSGRSLHIEVDGILSLTLPFSRLGESSYETEPVIPA